MKYALLCISFLGLLAFTMSFELPPLPYAKNALEPHISAETLEYHYEKHHRNYVNTLNTLAQGTPIAQMSLDDIVLKERGKIFNMAAQVWNHNFYWRSMRPPQGGEAAPPTGRLLDLINKKWQSFASFKSAFNEEAKSHFGSGWTWLVRDDQNDLSIVSTHDAGCPITDGLTPLLTCDVWEHAYYIDTRNDRGAYLESWWKVVDWEFAEKNLA